MGNICTIHNFIVLTRTRYVEVETVRQHCCNFLKIHFYRRHSPAGLHKVQEANIHTMKFENKSHMHIQPTNSTKAANTLHKLKGT